jgi:hypothetical protein
MFLFIREIASVASPYILIRPYRNHTPPLIADILPPSIRKVTVYGATATYQVVDDFSKLFSLKEQNTPHLEEVTIISNQDLHMNLDQAAGWLDILIQESRKCGVKLVISSHSGRGEMRP